MGELSEFRPTFATISLDPGEMGEWRVRPVEVIAAYHILTFAGPA
jgi:hypothetical protein